MLFGQHPLVTIFLRALGDPEVPRLRDCYLEDGHIHIYTRTGGGNREYYEAENAALQHHPEYVSDEDDGYDCTYATFTFRIPAAWSFLRALESSGPPRQKWEKLMAGFADGKPLEELIPAEAIEQLKALFGAIGEKLKGEVKP
jgi:S-adenosylhomocysteine hydrolase